MTAKQNVTALDAEPVAGRKLLLTFDGEEFEIGDILADGEDWEVAMETIAALSGEMGSLRMRAALVDIIGPDRNAKLKEKGWGLRRMLNLSAALGERLGATMGTPGE